MNRFNLSEKEEIRAAIIEEDGRLQVSLWVYHKKEGFFVPTEKRLNVPLSLFDRLKEVILALKETLARREFEKPPAEKKVIFTHPS